jgi:hypothetical protein
MKMASFLLLVSVLVFPRIAWAQSDNSFRLKSTDQIETINVTVDEVSYLGRTGIHLQSTTPDFEKVTIGLIREIEFSDGVIEVELSGEPGPDTGPNHRGFVGIAFRVDSNNPENYECIYLRPSNGRAGEQQQRNHTTQYVSHPDHTWYRLRKEDPGKYESYVDIVPGEWTKVRIEVKGKQAKLYVHGATQPCLVVNDLKSERTSGSLGLWIAAGTDAHFRNLTVGPLPE